MAQPQVKHCQKLDQAVGKLVEQPDKQLMDRIMALIHNFSTGEESSDQEILTFCLGEFFKVRVIFYYFGTWEKRRISSLI